MRDTFIKIAKEANTADAAAIKMYSLVFESTRYLRLFYVCAANILTERFGEKETISAVSQFAHFDIDHENKLLANCVKRIITKFEQGLSYDVFIDNINNGQIAGYTTGDLLYVAHKCVKPNSKKFQVTVLGRGLGPLSDTQHDTAEGILKNDITGAGIPFSAVFLNQADLLKHEAQFMPK